VRMAMGRKTGASAENDAPPPPPPADTVARAETRSGPSVGDVAKGAAAQAMQGEEGGPGMSATPRPNDPEDRA
jgi:hypothetical protein